MQKIKSLALVIAMFVVLVGTAQAQWWVTPTPTPKPVVFKSPCWERADKSVTNQDIRCEPDVDWSASTARAKKPAGLSADQQVVVFNSHASDGFAIGELDIAGNSTGEIEVESANLKGVTQMFQFGFEAINFVNTANGAGNDSFEFSFREEGTSSYRVLSVWTVGRRSDGWPTLIESSRSNEAVVGAEGWVDSNGVQVPFPIGHALPLMSNSYGRFYAAAMYFSFKEEFAGLRGCFRLRVIRGGSQTPKLHIAFGPTIRLRSQQ